MELSDVTLREGAQMPGRSYTVEQLLEAGRALDRLGLGSIQAGFPVVDDRHSTVVREMSDELDTPVTALARAIPADVDAAIDAEPDAIHVFASISDPMLEHVFGKPRKEVVKMLEGAIDRAHDAGFPVRVGLMDGFRTDPEHVIALAEQLPDATIGVADTVGGRTPRFVEEFLETINDAGVDLSRISVHFHDDLGLATANAMVAARAGVSNADVSVASLGERAGNTPIEQVVVAGMIENDDAFGVNTDELVPACRDVLSALGEDITPRRPILGEETVTHESGLHTAVMLEEPWVFEPFDPATFGGERELVFGSITGRGAARTLLEQADRDVTDERIAVLLDRLEEEGPTDLDGALELARKI